MTGELEAFIVPDGTKMEERTILVDGDVVIGDHADVSYGIIANSVLAGERVNIRGHIKAESEVRLDLWTHVGGDVTSKNDAYIAEFVNIDGKLTVLKDFNVGKNVKIKGGFDARGWLVVRNPVPVVVYVFLYLVYLLRLGKEEEVEKALEELLQDAENRKLMILPGGTKVTPEQIRVPKSGFIGNRCRMLGNIRASALQMGNLSTLFGGVRTQGNIKVGKGSTVYGSLVTGGEVTVGRNSKVMGEINAGKITIHETSKVEGAMHAHKGVQIIHDDLNGMSDAEKSVFYWFELMDYAVT